MMPRTYGPVLLLVITLAGSSGAASSNVMPRYEAGRAVWDAASLRTAGVTRLSDLMLLAEGWGVATVDGFTWAASPRGLIAFEEQQWKVMLDGQVLEISAFGAMNLNRLPITLSTIDSVEFIDVPQIHEGEIVDGGVIHIHTRRPAEGASVRGRLLAGNETGDSGPYQFTELGTPNVDRIGPDYSLEGGYRHGQQHVWGGVKTMRQYVLDGQVRIRNQVIGGDADPTLEVIAPYLAMGAQALGGDHRFFGTVSYLDDYTFLKPYGREIPNRNRLVHAGVTGTIPMRENTTLGYKAWYTENALSYRQNTFDLDFDWKRRARTFQLEAASTTPSSHVSYGLGLSFVDIVTGFDVADDSYALLKLYATWRRRLATGLQQTLSGAAITGQHDTAISGMLSYEWSIAGRHVVTGGVSYMERLPEQDERVWYWDERGYAFLDSNGVAVRRLGTLEEARRFAADVTWVSRLIWGMSIEMATYFREFARSHLERQFFRFTEFDRSFTAPVHLRSGQEGRVFGANVAIDWRPHGKLRTRLAYRYQTAFHRTAAFKNLWDAVPLHALRYTLAFTPVRNFSLWTRVNFWGPSRWGDYVFAETESRGRYRDTVDDVMRWDVALQQWMWQRRLRASLVVQNILDNDVRYHPIGATFDLTAFVQIELLLDGIGR